ncbi:hypothetical protein [Cloacibacillus sp. An23]|uniref:hypothetical protein n=1 Tax=Cloacibacillus sp. An23 TaxID=1965591 RepID=UPI000B36A207|nr:hypothetical protein [Cloacibacillus sp. An23]OUO95234.1 hypothetical protein B5F39_01525 [Cloacibacillus sp. An23]
MVLLGLTALLISITLCAVGYVFAAYVMFRVGEKFRVGRFRDYLVPVWNLMLMCDCAGVTRLTAAGLALPAPLFWIICAAGAPSLEIYAGRALAALFAFCWVYLWGSAAERLGKNFWLWGVLCLLFGGLPVLFLAFDDSMPRG